ncbi:transposase [Lacisediminihabitans profunda]|uniref:Transposase n=1 Tax=Lacisediminihabitans profunda TaxID=2594790 RepID=A0A5C8UW64_9MICO|nr:transposase [Lacisediminihabitans profunda]
MPRPYPAEFRERALELVRSGRTVVETAELLGIAQSCLYRWKQLDLVDRGLKPDSARVESRTLAVAKARCRRAWLFGLHGIVRRPARFRP